jgi:hypothetical protein
MVYNSIMTIYRVGKKELYKWWQYLNAAEAAKP